MLGNKQSFCSEDKKVEFETGSILLGGHWLGLMGHGGLGGSEGDLPALSLLASLRTRSLITAWDLWEEWRVIFLLPLH